MIPFLKEQINALINEANDPLPIINDFDRLYLEVVARTQIIITQSTKIQAGKDLIRLLRVGQELEAITTDEFFAVITAANLGQPYDSDSQKSS